MSDYDKSPNGVQDRHLHWLDELRLPPGRADNGRSVKPQSLLRVLRAIASFGRTCYASLNRIALRAGHCRRHTIQAIQALMRLDLVAPLSDGRAKRKTIEYAVVWQNVERYAREGLGSPGSQPATGALAPATGALAPATGALAPPKLKELKVRTQSELEPSSIDTRGQCRQQKREVKKAFPDLSCFELYNSIDVSNCHQLLVSLGIMDDCRNDLEDVALAAIMAVRLADRNPHGYMARILTEGFSRHGPANADRQRLKQMMRQLDGYEHRSHK